MDQSQVRKHKHAKCEECPLREKGKYVPSTFPGIPINDDSNYGRRIAIVGESPGRLEVAKGRPFIGPSGQVMDAVLSEHGIDRQQTLVTNAFNCHYSEQDFDKPPPEAIEACRPRLLHEMEQVGVDTAITVGAIAAKALIDTKTGITKLRGGAPKRSSYADGVTVIPTFHPAYALRDQSKFRYIVQDIAKIKPGGVWGTWKDPEIEVVHSPAIGLKYVNLLNKEKDQAPLVCDTESGADKEDTFEGGIKEVLCVGIWYAEGNKVIVFTPESLDKFNRKLLGKVLMARGIDAQNGKYDVSRCLNVYFGVDEVLDIPVYFDTMLAHYCLDEGKGVHSLDYMAMEYLDAPDHKGILHEAMEEGKKRAKAERKKQGLPLKGIFVGTNFAWVDKPTLYWYNALDVYTTKLLRDKFKVDLVADNVNGLHDWLMKISGMLVHVETNGMAVDLDYNMQLEVKYRQMLDSIDLGAQDINPNSPLQVKKYLETIGVKVESTNKTTLKMLAEQAELSGREDVAAFCNGLLEHRGASKMMGTYVTGIRKALIDGVIHPTFLLHGTTSGRPSCRGPNLQNIPRGSDIRRQFVPSRRGRVFVQADYSQAEFRVITWLGKDALARQMFIDSRPGEDVFVQLCRRMYGSVEFASASKAQKKEMRTLIKTMAYGIMYGREAKAIGIAFGIPLRVAQRQMNEFTSMIPGIMAFQKEIVEQVCAGEDLVTPFGRRRRFHLITNANIVDVRNEAKSFKPQSIASDICLESAWELDQMGLELRNIVHDSILAECEVHEIPEVSRLLREVMVRNAEKVTEGYVPFEVDIEVGETWGDLGEAA
jgi:uracil-DNA glycosylase family 4